MKDPWNYLENKKDQRRRRRRIMGGVLVVIIIVLLLLPIHCDDNPPLAIEPDAATKSASLTQLPLRLAPQRVHFGNQLGEWAPWSAELFNELQKRKVAVKNCFPQANSKSFSWKFSYQIKSGMLLDQGFTWKEDEPDEATKLCLQRVLETEYKVSAKSKDPIHWYSLSINYSDD